MTNHKLTPQDEQARRWFSLGGIGGYLLLGALFSILGTIGFAWLADEVFENEFEHFDVGILLWLKEYHTPFNDQVMMIITTLGDPYLLGGLVTIVTLILLYQRQRLDAFGLVLAVAGSGIINQILKFSYERTRPDLYVGPFQLSSYSFPSGHAMGSISCYGALAYLLLCRVHSPLWRIVIILLAAMLIISIGMSRLYFGVHYPTDVLGGYLAGGSWLAIAIGLTETLRWWHQRQST